MEYILLVIGIMVSAYICAVIFLYVSQRNILYVPDKSLKEPHHYGLSNTHILHLITKDDLSLTAWHYHHQPTDAYTIIYFHGNTGHIGDRAYKFKAFIEHGFNVLALSYRGFGTSQGSPSEQGLYLDAHTAINYLTQTQHIPTNKIIYYGESLGSGVAVELTTHTQPKLVVLEAPYASMIRVASEKYPIIPAELLLKDQYRNDQKIAHINTPLLIFHGDKDEVIPFSHSESLYTLARDPKEFIHKPGIDHTGFDPDNLAHDMTSFLKKL